MLWQAYSLNSRVFLMRFKRFKQSLGKFLPIYVPLVNCIGGILLPTTFLHLSRDLNVPSFLSGRTSQVLRGRTFQYGFLCRPKS